MTVRDDVFKYVPFGKQTALSHRSIWKLMGEKWSVISCRHALAELADEGLIKSEIGDVGFGPPTTRYWRED